MADGATNRKANGIANLRPHWKPGQSGNPKGRPPKLVDISAMAREYGPECVRKCVALMRNSPDERVQFAATKELMDRGYGRPTQAVEATEREQALAFRHLIAAQAASQLLQQRILDGEATDVDTDTNVDTPDRLAPALE